MNVLIKICGVTTPAMARTVADLGADAVGINFYPKSPRYVAPNTAVEIVAALPPFTAAVGVFVGEPDDAVNALAVRLGLRAVQTYADAPPTRRFDPAAHIPAFRVRDRSDLAVIREFVAACRPAAVLVDSFVAGEMGGTGHRAPWDLLVGFDPGVPLILAGGLTPENVGEAIRTVRPWGVDVASGVESAPGIKDSGKVDAFVRAVRDAEREIGRS